MSTTVDKLREKLADQMGLTPKERAELDEASSHDHECDCAICLRYWAECGPDGDDYGPFTKMVVNAEQRRLGLEVT